MRQDKIVAVAGKTSLAVVLLMFFLCQGAAAQESVFSTHAFQARQDLWAAFSQKKSAQPSPPCIQPPPTLTWKDYRGPFAKTVGALAGRLERKSVGEPHYKPGVRLCTLVLKDKFKLFVQDTIDPISFLNAGFNAGIGQADDTDPTYGQGAAGYGKRFGANLIGQASSEFFKDFAYPTIFFEDPRYYRLGEGPFRSRLFHAVSHVVVAYRENGSRMFNFSEWLGTSSAVALSNVYHPDNRRGFVPAAERVAYGFANDIGFDILREFWPEVARKFKLPFRYSSKPPDEP